MRRRTKLLTALFAAVGMGFLILDAKTALQGAKEGIDLCLITVIPSLFPFFVFSILLTNGLSGVTLPCFGPVCRVLGIPQGSESLVLAGFLGGYPVGAQCVAQAYRAKRLSKEAAERMLGFCSNAGPAFIFGMASALFRSPAVPWALWGIHILAAVLTALALPGKTAGRISTAAGKETSLPQALRQAVRVMGEVCGWILLFRVLIAIAQRWCLWLLPKAMQITLTGLLELSNGCCELYGLAGEGGRFLLFAGFLGFGGLCVAMQTMSVTAGLGTGAYFPGKALQGVFSIVLAAAVQSFLFPPAEQVHLPPAAWAVLLLCGGVLLLFVKKSPGNPVGIRV